MSHLDSGKNLRHYMVSDSASGASLFVVEAQDHGSAVKRGKQVVIAGLARTNGAILAARECVHWEGVPHFLDGFFDS